MSLTRNEKTWMMLSALVVLVTVVAGSRAYFRGDVWVALFVQWLAPSSTVWAEWLTSTAKFPWSLGLPAPSTHFSGKTDSVKPRQIDFLGSPPPHIYRTAMRALPYPPHLGK